MKIPFTLWWFYFAPSYGRARDFLFGMRGYSEAGRRYKIFNGGFTYLLLVKRKFKS